MTRLHRALVALTLVAALAAALTPAAQAQAGGTKLTAKLTGTKAFPGVSGKATFKRESGQRELEVEIEHAKSLHGKRLAVFVGGKKIGTMVVGQLGNARLDRSTQRGQSVPLVTAGTGVSVHTAAGAAVAKGRF
jgi:uncharacterized protein (DUF2141 family)